MREIYQKRKRPLRAKLHSLLTGVGAVLLTAAAGSNMQAQVSGYTFSQSNGTFNSIAATGTVVTGSEATTTTTNDSAGWTVSLPFNFAFNGVGYSSIYVNSNGAATFGATTSTSSTIISTTTGYEGAIGVMNRDLFGAFVTSGVTTSGSNVITNVVSMRGIEVGKLLNNVNGIPASTTVTAFDEVAGTITMSNSATSSSAAAVVRYGTGRVYTATEGTAPNRVFVIEWNGYNDYGTTASVSNFMTFQLRLSETTNRISTVYGSYYNVSTTNRTNQIGLRGATATDYNNRSGAVGNPWTSTSAGTANNASVSRDNTNFPPSGLTFTWSPPTCYAPTSLSTGTLGLNSAEINWVAPTSVPAMGYEIYYNTTGIAPDGSTVLDGTNSLTTAAGSLTGTISGLTSGTQYFVWVRGKCGATDSSNWSSVISFATTCTATSAPYSQNFDSTPVGSTTSTNAPACWSYLETSGSVGYGHVTTTNALSAPNSYILGNGADTTGDIMLVSPQTLNLSDGTKWVKFSVRAGGANYTMDVGTLSDPTNPGTLNILSTITLTTAYVEHTVVIPAGTSQYLAFRHGLGGSSRTVYLDNITVENSPTCFEPTAVQVTPGSPTGSSGVLTWTAPTTAATGYEVYYSTVNTAPTAATVLNGTNSVSVSGTTATISGLSPSTTYYVWVRTVCSATDKSVWTPTAVTLITICQPPAITGTNVNPTPVCMGGTATLTATADAGATVNWYADATSTTALATGPTYTTPVLTATTNYYVSASVGGTQSAGFPNAVSTSGYTLEAGLFFDALTGFVIEGVYVYPIGTGAGTVVIALQDGNVSPALTLQTITVNLTGTPAPYVKTFVPLNFTVAPGSNYKLMMMSRTGGVASLVRESGTAWGTYPITTPGVMSITNGNCCSGNTTATSYYYFYDWQISGKCESPRTMVTATYDSTCTMGTSELGEDNAVNIYPNPFTDIVNISDAKDLKSVSVVDMSGRMVRSIANPGRQINLAELKSGLYILKLDFKDGSVQNVKVIKK